MHQLIQEVSNGRLRLSRIATPVARPGHVLISNRASLISAGTEKAVRELAQKSLLEKARERPDQVRRVLEKAQQEGVVNTYKQVRERLSDQMPLGYSSSGVVVECGEGVQEFKPGDRVASNGPHADMVVVPRNLCAHLQDDVSFDQAAFAVVGAIALHGIRLSQVGLGETVFVVGLGLIGQIAVALGRAAGCRVIATDLDSHRCLIAKEMGAETAAPGINATQLLDQTNGFGADAVVVAAATPSNQPLQLASRAVRKKGRIALIGSVGMQLDRRSLYDNEAEVVVSSSYGPGRYDPAYEDLGHDYPAAYVRWTEQRNIQAVLDLMAAGALDVTPLISHRFSLDQAGEAYELIESGKEPCLGVLFDYDGTSARKAVSRVVLSTSPLESEIGVGLIGAGNFARGVLIPKLQQAEPDAGLKLVCTSGGLSATTVGERFGFEAATTSPAKVFSDPKVNCVFIATRHNLHAELVTDAIKSGKHVFVEKPLALTQQELDEIDSALVEAGDDAPLVTVGFNRRFSPAARIVRDFFSQASQPLTVSIRFNAGSLPPDHWTQIPEIGGGRIIGEACHAIDLAIYLTGAPVERVFAESIGGNRAPKITDDQCFITLRHSNGSVSNVAYLAGGDHAFPKERIEVAGSGRMAVIDDFRSVTTAENGKKKVQRMRQQDKGHLDELKCFFAALEAGGPAPIPWEDLRSTTLASILAVKSLRNGFPISLDLESQNESNS